MKIKKITCKEIKERMKEFLEKSKKKRYQFILMEKHPQEDDCGISLWWITENDSDENWDDDYEYGLENKTYTINFNEWDLENNYNIYEIIRN